MCTTRNWFQHLLLVALLSLWVLPASAAPKTDTVIFKNGDRLTGEIKSLKRGQLNLNTEATGTIGIEWDKISNVISNQQIQVETSNGTRYFGTLASSDKGSSIVVVNVAGRQTLDAERVIVMSPIEERGIRRQADEHKDGSGLQIIGRGRFAIVNSHSRDRLIAKNFSYFHLELELDTRM